MADIERTVAVVFSGTDQLSGTINSLAGGLDSFSGKVTDVTQPLADMAANVLKIEAALSALALGGLALAVKSAGDFAAQFAEISTLIDVPADSLGAFEDAILSYSISSTQSIDAINQSIYDAISAGVDYEDSLGALAAAEKLGVATKAELTDALNLLVPTLNAFGKDMGSASDFADILFSTVKSGKTTLTELAGPLGQITGLAGPAGVSFDQLGAAIAGLTASGLETPQAITGLKAALANIIKPSSEAEKASKALGISFDAQALSAMGLEKFLQMVFEATGGNITEMGKLFGSMEGLNAAFKLGEDSSGKYAAALEAMANRTGAVDTAFGKMAENAELAVQSMVNSLKVALIELGGPLLDEYVGIINQIGAAFDGISIGIQSDAFKPVLDLLESFGDDVEEVLRKIGIQLNDPDFWANIDFTPLVDSIRNLGQSLGGAFEAVFGDIDLTTPAGLEAAIEKVVGALAALTNITAGIVDAWEPFLKVVGEGIDIFADLEEGTAKSAGTFLGLGQAINTVFSNVGGLSTALTALAYTISAGSLFKGVSSLIGLIGAGAAAGAGTLIGAFGAATVATIAFFAELERRDADDPKSFGQIFEEIKESANYFPIFISNLADAANELLNLDGRSKAWWLSQGYLNDAIEEGRLRQAAYSNELRATPEKVTTVWDVQNLENAKQDLGLVNETLTALSEGRTIEISAEADVESAEEARDFIVETVYKDGEEITIITQVGADEASINDTKAAIDTIPTEKLLEIRLQGEIDTEIAKIKAQAETIQTAVEWSAKLDIAEAEAAAEKFKASADLISESFANTGDVLLGLFDIYSDAGGLKGLAIGDWIEQESKRRDALLKLETELVQSEIELTQAKAAAVERGDPLITITGEGLEPELEAFMWAILRKVQIRAAEDNAPNLLEIA